MNWYRSIAALFFSTIGLITAYAGTISVPFPGPGISRVNAVSVTGQNVALTSTTDQSSYLFSSVSGLNAHSGLIICVTIRGASGAQTVTGIDVSGTAAVFAQGGTNGSQRAEVWAVLEGTTSPNITVSLTGNAANILTAVYAVSGLNSTTKVASNTSNSDPASVDANANAGGIAVACGLNGIGAAGSMNWTGVTSQYYTTLETSFSHTGGYDLTPTTETPRTITGDWSSSNFPTVVSATFR